MSVQVKVAGTPEEADAVFRLRHTVFAEEEGYFPRTLDGRIHDRFDELATVTHFVAYVQDRVVGCIRYNDCSVDGTPPDEYFDFKAHFPAPPACVGTGSMVAVMRDYRRTPRLTAGLFGVFFLWAHAQRVTHIYGVANPDRLEAFARNGFRALAPRQFSGLHQLPFIPIILDLRDLPLAYKSFIEQHSAYPQIPGSARQLYVAGETILPSSDAKPRFYTLVSGQVGIRAACDPQAAPRRLDLRTGDQLATGGPLTIDGQRADLVALSDLDLAMDDAPMEQKRAPE
jgi:hypothetical protein